MEDDVLEAHLKTFVTDFSIDLGREGRVAILKLAQVALEKGLVPELPHDIFLT
jgi:predicted solute-binding protein